MVTVFFSNGTLWANENRHAFDEGKINCVRTNDNTFGFTDASALEWWFPRELSLSVAGWSRLDGQKSIILKDLRTIYQLLPSGRLIGSLEQQAGYKTVNNIRYKCDMTAMQVIEAEKSRVVVNAESLSSISNDSSEQSVDEAEAYNLGDAKSTCTDLGFKRGTEGYGTCVLRVSGKLTTAKAASFTQQKTISSDTKLPTITTSSATTSGAQGVILGKAQLKSQSFMMGFQF